MKTLVGYNGDTPIYKNDDCEQNKTDMKQELKPCPFCGEQPMVSEKTLSVYCKNALCPQIIANESDNLTDAIQGWNTRPDHSGESAEMVKGETLTAEIDWEQRKWNFVSHTLSLFLAENGTQYMQRDRCGNPIGGKDRNFTSIITDYIVVANELINQLKKTKR